MVAILDDLAACNGAFCGMASPKPQGQRARMIDAPARRIGNGHNTPECGSARPEEEHQRGGFHAAAAFANKNDVSLSAASTRWFPVGAGRRARSANTGSRK
jgi:hypothetical protein